MTIQIKQQTIPKGKDWWDWSVWLEGAKEELDAINQVVYTLHPTFSTPVISVTDRKTGFRLISSGWGEFMIYIRIKGKGGSTKKRKHYLRFVNSALNKGKVTRKLRVSAPMDKSSRRTVFVSGGTRDIDTVHAVREVLSRKNVEVVGAQDIKAGQEWLRSINGMIEKSDAAVFVVSGRPNLWMNEEIKAAVKAGVRHIFPVVVGSNVELPDMLQTFQAVHIDSPSAVEGLVEKILNRSLGKK